MMLLTTLVISVFGFVSFASAQFSETGKNNVVVYWVSNRLLVLNGDGTDLAVRGKDLLNRI